MGIIEIIILIVLILLLVIASGIFSFSEMALANMSRIRIKTIIKTEINKRKKSQAIRISKLRENYNQASTSIVIMNNIVNILSTTLAATLFNGLFSSAWGIVLSTIVMTIMIVTFGEIFPKLLAKKYPEAGAMKLSWVIKGCYLIFLPITKIINKVIPPEREVIFKNEQELNFALDEGSEVGIIDRGENEIIKNALEFDKDKIETIMVKENEIFHINSNIVQSELNEKIFNTGYSRIPVINGEGNAIGILQVKKYLNNVLNNEANDSFTVIFENSITEPLFLEKDEIARNAFNKLRSERKSMAIVIEKDVDENIHKMIGIVTLEDLVEEIMGEIYDENDIEEDGVYELGINTIEISYWTNAKTVFEDYFPDIEIDINGDINFGEWVYKTFNNKNLSSNNFFEEENYFHYDNLLIWIKNKNNINDIKFEIDIIE